MAHDAIDPSFRDLIDEHAPVRQIGSGFMFTEGPIWHPKDQFLMFSDMPGDVRRRWAHGEGVAEVMRPSHKGNGMTYDQQLNLLVCEHATSSVARFTPAGERTVLCSHFEGRELNSPNDICVKSDGSIWFTDPTYGRMPGFGIERPVELGFQGVYKLPRGHQPGDEPELVVARSLFSQPNGLCFSPDESRLYINDTDQHNIRVYDVGPDGQLGHGRVFASGVVDRVKRGVPDGMKCDHAGNVWVTAPGGLWVYNPDGRLIGSVSLPEMAANFHWGGPDWRSLYVCAETSVYEIPVKIGPRNEPFMRVDAGPAAPPAPPPAAARGATADRSDQPKQLAGDRLILDPMKCALIIQDMQNDVVIDGGAFAESGSPEHCRQQNAIPNGARLAEVCRRKGVLVIHVWFVVEPGAAGVTLNAPLFHGVRDANALVRDSWGAAPVEGLQPQPGDFTVLKNRMSPWECTTLDVILKSGARDTIINTGAWTNMSVEHTARTGADRGYKVVLPEDACSTMNADWHAASINYAMQNVATVTDVDTVIAALGG